MTENVVEWQRNSPMATVTFCQGKYITKIRKLAERFPDECEIVAENEDGSIMAHIPTKWIKINNPRREISDEEREELAERMRNQVQSSVKDT